MSKFNWLDDCFELQRKVGTAAELEYWLETTLFAQEALPASVTWYGMKLAKAEYAWQKQLQQDLENGKPWTAEMEASSEFKTRLSNFVKIVLEVYDDLSDDTDHTNTVPAYEDYDEDYKYYDEDYEESGWTDCDEEREDLYLHDQANDDIMSHYADYSDFDEMDPSELSEFQYL